MGDSTDKKSWTKQVGEFAKEVQSFFTDEFAKEVKSFFTDDFQRDCNRWVQDLSRETLHAKSDQKKLDEIQARYEQKFRDLVLKHLKKGLHWKKGLDVNLTFDDKGFSVESSLFGKIFDKISKLIGNTVDHEELTNDILTNNFVQVVVEGVVNHQLLKKPSATSKKLEQEHQKKLKQLEQEQTKHVMILAAEYTLLLFSIIGLGVTAAPQLQMLVDYVVKSPVADGAAALGNFIAGSPLGEGFSTLKDLAGSHISSGIEAARGYVAGTPIESGASAFKDFVGARFEDGQEQWMALANTIKENPVLAGLVFALVAGVAYLGIRYENVCRNPAAGKEIVEELKENVKYNIENSNNLLSLNQLLDGVKNRITQNIEAINEGKLTAAAAASII